MCWVECARCSAGRALKKMTMCAHSKARKIHPPPVFRTRLTGLARTGTRGVSVLHVRCRRLQRAERSSPNVLHNHGNERNDAKEG